MIEPSAQAGERIEPVRVHEVGHGDSRPIAESDRVPVCFHGIAELDRIQRAASGLGPPVRCGIADELADLMGHGRRHRQRTVEPAAAVLEDRIQEDARVRRPHVVHVVPAVVAAGLLVVIKQGDLESERIGVADDGPDHLTPRRGDVTQLKPHGFAHRSYRRFDLAGIVRRSVDDLQRP